VVAEGVARNDCSLRQQGVTRSGADRFPGGVLSAHRQRLCSEALVGHPAERQAPVTFALFVVAPLVVALCVLISRINHAEYFAPQAYYQQKTGGAPLALEYESLGPRARKLPPSEARDAAR
jgi:hypothetical protein